MTAIDRMLYLNLDCKPVGLEELYEQINDHVLHLLGMAQLTEYVLTQAEGVLSIDVQTCIMLIRNTLRRIGQSLDGNIKPETIWTEAALEDGFDATVKRLQGARAAHLAKEGGAA